MRAYRVSGVAPEDGACLVFAPTAREAKAVASRSPAWDWLVDLIDGEWINLRVRWLRVGADYYRVPELERKGESYVVEAPESCGRCENWYADGLEPTTGLCWSCFEDQEAWEE